MQWAFLLRVVYMQQSKELDGRWVNNTYLKVGGDCSRPVMIVDRRKECVCISFG